MTKAIMVRFSEQESAQIKQLVYSGKNRSMADAVRKATILYIEKELLKQE